MFQGVKVCLATLLLAVAINGESDTGSSVNQQLVNFMAKNSELTRQNPDVAVGCFQHYLPIMSELGATYEKQYDACLGIANSGIVDLDGSVKPAEAALSLSATEACDAISACSAENATVSTLNCYVNVGTSNSGIMHNIGVNASSILADYQQKLQNIKFTETRCILVAKNEYTANSASTYEQLQDCLLEKTAVPSATTTAAPETTAAPAETTTAETTAAPATTTTVETTAAPATTTTVETTEAPAITTTPAPY